MCVDLDTVDLITNAVVDLLQFCRMVLDQIGSFFRVFQKKKLTFSWSSMPSKAPKDLMYLASRVDSSDRSLAGQAASRSRPPSIS